MENTKRILEDILLQTNDIDMTALERTTADDKTVLQHLDTLCSSNILKSFATLYVNITIYT